MRAPALSLQRKDFPMYSVLYVDDEPGLLEIGKLFLESTRDFTVGTSTSAAEALALLGTRSFDAVISDYQMPGMDGLAFLKEVRSQYGDIPFLLYTGRGREEVIIEAINYGVDFYIQKGGDATPQFAELAHKLRMAIRRKHAESALRESEEKFRGVFNNANDAIYIHAQDADGPGQFLEVNDFTCSLLGYSREELTKMRVTDILAGTHLPEVPRISRTIQEEGRNTFYAEFRGKEGTTLPVEVNVRVYQFSGKTIILAIARDITERKRAEQKLRESEERFRGIFENQMTGTLLIDPATHIIVDANEKAAAIAGAPRDQIVGRICHLFICPAEAGACPVTDLGQTIDQSERILINAQGERVPILKFVKKLDLGDRPYLIETFIDITERKRAEQALRESEKKYRDIIENMQDVVYRTDRNGKLTMFSPYGVKLAGYQSEQEMIGLDVALDTYYDPKDRETFLAALRQKGHVENYPLKLRARNGKARMVTTSSHFYYDDKGTVHGIEGIIHDFTDRFEAEQALRESEEKYHDLFDLNKAVMLIVDPADGRIVDANNAACGFYGYSKEEITGFHIMDINVARTGSILTDMSHAANAEGRVFHFRHRKKNGEIRDVEVFSAPVAIQGKRFLHSIILDVTDYKRRVLWLILAGAGAGILFDLALARFGVTLLLPFLALVVSGILCIVVLALLDSHYHLFKR